MYWKAGCIRMNCKGNHVKEKKKVKKITANVVVLLFLGVALYIAMAALTNEYEITLVNAYGGEISEKEMQNPITKAITLICLNQLEKTELSYDEKFTRRKMGGENRIVLQKKGEGKKIYIGICTLMGDGASAYSYYDQEYTVPVMVYKPEPKRVTDTTKRNKLNQKRGTRTEYMELLTSARACDGGSGVQLCEDIPFLVIFFAFFRPAFRNVL